MFERYDENARRAVFFARYEASQSGSSQIGSLHLLLGILRESGTLFTLADDSISVNDLIEDCRRALPDHCEKTSTSVDMPLSSECQQALAEALMQSESQVSRFVQPVHLVLGLITASKDVAAILSKHGITAKKLSGEPSGDREKPAAASPSAVMEFVCQGERVASTPVNFTNPLPRVGDEVVFTRESKTETYKVLRVQHHFEGPPLTKTLAHCWLVKVIVETERVASAQK